MCSGQEGQRIPVSETKWKEDSSNSRPGRESLRFVLCLPETYPGNYYSVISSSKGFFFNLIISCMGLLCQLVIKTDV